MPRLLRLSNALSSLNLSLRHTGPIATTSLTSTSATSSTASATSTPSSSSSSLSFLSRTILPILKPHTTRLITITPPLRSNPSLSPPRILQIFTSQLHRPILSSSSTPFLHLSSSPTTANQNSNPNPNPQRTQIRSVTYGMEYQPSQRKRKRKHGFLARSKGGKAGRKMLANRRMKGRRFLSH